MTLVMLRLRLPMIAAALDTSAELLLARPLQHDLKQFMLDFPSRVIVDTDFPGQLQRRDALLALGQKIDGEEPLGQQQSGSMKNRSSGDGGLMMTTVTLGYLEKPVSPAFRSTLRDLSIGVGG